VSGVRKLQIHLAAVTGTAGTPAGLDDLARRLAAACGPDAGCGTAVRLDPDPSRTILIGPDATVEHRATIEVRGEPRDPELLVDVLHDVDRATGLRVASVLIGAEHVVAPHEHALVLTYRLHRLPALTTAEFQRYWLGHHAGVALEVPGLSGYRQFHVAVDESAALCDRLAVDDPMLDGVAEIFFPTTEAFRTLMASSAVAVAAYQDERRFIDHRRSQLGLFRRTVIRTPLSAPAAP